MSQDMIFAGADESTPSRSQYFSWINNTNEGATERQTLINIDFFQWLHDQYGMRLDIYAWDAGNLDGPRNDYGSLDTERFRQQYPNGFDAIVKSAKDFGCRMGIWGGPDGFGETAEDEAKRTETMVKLCRDYQFMLFKIDAVCGQLREEKQEAFARMMSECRKHAPDLILLNHRLRLGKAMPHATTWLWEGAETYIDVHMKNEITGTHSRVGALSRGLPPELQRLTEDHGVCISSCLDFWDDDLILQAFNRGLILAPEIYGNPWLMRDDEFPKLARIYNLHRRYRDILVNGMQLPEDEYGPFAISRGDEATRLITLRNLNWEPVTYEVRLDEAIGLTAADRFELRQFHPTERMLGHAGFGDSVAIEVAPFRSCLLIASAQPIDEPGVEGCDYEIVRDVPGKPLQIKLLGQAGSTVDLRITGRVAQEMTVTFDGEPLERDWHRRLADLSACELPADATALYEATCFAADNNALELRELERSGETTVPQVQTARDAFFEQDFFWLRGVCDRFMFDGKRDTFFGVWHRGEDNRIDGGALRIDFGKNEEFDQLQLSALWPDEREALAPQALRVELSKDLRNWETVTLERCGGGDKVGVADILENGGKVEWFGTTSVDWCSNGPVRQARYLRLADAPDRIREVAASLGGTTLDRSAWRASVLFAPPAAAQGARCCSAAVELGKEAPNSYICIAVDGEHGENKVYAAARIGDELVGVPRRAPSYPCMPWEAPLRPVTGNTSHFIPVTPDMHGKRIELFVLELDGGSIDSTPHAWITAHPAPLAEKHITLS